MPRCETSHELRYKGFFVAPLPLTFEVLIETLLIEVRKKEVVDGNAHKRKGQKRKETSVWTRFSQTRGAVVGLLGNGI